MGQWYITDVNSMKKFFLGILSVLLFSTSLVSCSDDNSANPQDPGVGNYEYVDLGLSVKWAKCNIGANAPQDFGAYFAWGETEPKSSYTWSNYKWCDGTYNTLTKYCTDATYGKVDNKSVLDLNDDAAYINWKEDGVEWRMPTATEFEELIENCEWVWSTVEKVKGYTIISKVNGNSIFLPAAGAIEIPSYETQNIIGYYWTSNVAQLCPEHEILENYNAVNLTFYKDAVYITKSTFPTLGTKEDIYMSRRYGLPIRPVCKK